MSELLGLLAEYASALERGAAAAGVVERPEYERRAAAATAIGAALRASDSRELKRLIDEEEHAQGWSYLQGDLGAGAEGALGRLIYLARKSGATFAA